MAAVMNLFVCGVGVVAPGLLGWEAARPVLTGQQAWRPEPLPRLAPAWLPADQRRRSTDHIRIGIEAAAQAVTMAGVDPATIATVFTSADADGALTRDICEEVSKSLPQVSPTRFHNSVNNAPAGYWCMGAGSAAPSTSLAAYDASFTAGLIEAMAMLAVEVTQLLLVAHDTPFPEPLHTARTLTAPFGVALLLSRAPAPNVLAQLRYLGIAHGDISESPQDDPYLEALRTGNPAARALPLLTALTRLPAATRVVLPYVQGRNMVMEVAPC